MDGMEFDSGASADASGRARRQACGRPHLSSQ